ncbi:MAG TPA: 6-hydroxymethylpterin diphosphokinase MptE-like protein, partial [Spirochaetota bacterium]|nr:6-hydroxymethylpterin diphosphokinase MptE-like protein [Spirochaetota bacterium]
VEREAGAIPLHSRTDPTTEAKRWTAGNTDGEEQVVFLFGFGLGYHIEELLASNEEVLIVVFEPSPTIFSAALRERDLTSVIKSDRVRIILGEESAPFDILVSDPSITRMKFLSLRSYQTLFPDASIKRKKEYVSWLNRRQINTATIRRFDRLWTSNTFKNSTYFFSLKGIEVMKERFQGIPAVVLCAGPSLEQDIGNLRKLSGTAVIFAVDTALRPIMKRGIVPDFVVSVDPQWVNSFILLSDPQLDKEPSELPVLVSDPAVYPATLREYRGLKIITSSVFAPGRVIERFSGPKGTIAAGGSVAVAAYDLARISGADPILLLGLDLSYSTTRTHLSGSFHDLFLRSRAHRLDTAHTQMMRYIAGGDPFVEGDKKGDPVLTDRRMMLYRSWFENEAMKSKARTINASSGGLSIEGIENIPIEELRHELVKGGSLMKPEAVSKLREELLAALPDFERAFLFLDFLEALIKKLEAVYRLAKQGLSLVKSAGSKPESRESLARITGKLDEIDREILSDRDTNNILSMVMQTSIADILGKVKKTKPSVESEGPPRTEGYESALENSRVLYRSIEEGAQFLSGLLEKSSKRIQELVIEKGPHADK